MLYFPQLTSGAVSQYPIVTRTVTRTVSNLLEDGDTIRMGDGGAAQMSWDLTLSGLATDEWNAIEQLFEIVQGGLGAFTFLDPASNLLAWSEDYSQTVWSVDPLLALGTGIQDALGGTGATRVTNIAQARQQLLQHISGPASYQYCFSVFLRSDASQIATLVQSASIARAERVCTVTPQWTRFALSGRFPVEDDGIAFGVSLEPGGSVDIFGPQVEPQPAAGKYKKTVDRSGVYAKCRFAMDSLTLTTQGPNQQSGVIRLVSNLATM